MDKALVRREVRRGAGVPHKVAQVGGLDVERLKASREGGVQGGRELERGDPCERGVEV